MSLFNLFFKIPSTYKVEKQKRNLEQSYKEFIEFKDSDELARYYEIDSYVKSDEFKQRKHEIENKSFSDTEESHKLARYKELKKDKRITLYYNFEASGLPKLIDEIEASGKAERYQELWKIVDSKEFITKSQNDNFKNTPEYKVKLEFDVLANDKNFKKYLEARDSDDYSSYREISKSDLLVEFKELEEFVHSEGFLNFKALMEGSKKKRYINSDEFKLVEELNGLKRSEKIISHLKLKEKNHFNLVENWDLIFEDDFKSNNLNHDKWITRHFWGETVLNDNYSVFGDQHCYKDENVSVTNGNLRIVTKADNCQGKIWDPKLGFITKNFKYSSGIVNTGSSFRQKYGKFEAKIKINNPKAITNAFWMLSNKSHPHINIMNTIKGCIEMGVLTKEGEKFIKNIAKKKAGRFANDFYIYTLEWTPKKLIWYINDVVIKEITNNIPDEEMYIALSSGINTNINGSVLPVIMEVDWVRCYELKD